MADKKKYPWIKSLFGRKKPPAEAVYAGPEYFEKRNRPRPEEAIEDVYAGPEYFERPADETGEEDAPPPPAEEAEPVPLRKKTLFGRVYAGPAYYKRRDRKAEPPETETEAGVEPIRCLYAGPELLVRTVEREEDVDQAEEPIDVVYAGPEYAPPKRPVLVEKPPEERDDAEESDPPRREPPIMFVYAGPAYFSRSDMIPAAPAPSDGPSDEYCAECGMPLPKEGDVCPACGAARPKKV
ncbi:MAG: hypothetical protein KIG36_03015 [Eubacteriales bacterium]|nr:hypothetical protein [Eubacteriales bacterium]